MLFAYPLEGEWYGIVCNTWRSFLIRLEVDAYPHDGDFSGFVNNTQPNIASTPTKCVVARVYFRLLMKLVHRIIAIISRFNTALVRSICFKHIILREDMENTVWSPFITYLYIRCTWSQANYEMVWFLNNSLFFKKFKCSQSTMLTWEDHHVFSQTKWANFH